MTHVTESLTPQWGGAETEIKVPSVENTELKGSHLKPGCGGGFFLTCKDFWESIRPFIPCLRFFLKSGD